MRESLKEDQPDLVTLGCPAHMLNILGQELTPSHVTKHIIEVQKYFCIHQHAAWIKETETTTR